jgi:hypothetical protein
VVQRQREEEGKERRREGKGRSRESVGCATLTLAATADGGGKAAVGSRWRGGVWLRGTAGGPRIALMGE